MFISLLANKSRFIVPPGRHFVTSSVSASFFYFQCIWADLAGDEGLFYMKNIFMVFKILLGHNKRYSDTVY